MKRLLTIFTVFMILTAVLIPGLHAQLTNQLSISGLPNPSGVEAFNVWYDVGDDFNLVGSAVGGNAIPPSITLGWAQDGATVGSGLFKFSGSNGDGWFSGIENNMLNGIFASFEYEGTINGVNFFQFGDIDGNEIGTINLDHFDANNTNFVVPIPPAILLPGGGLVGLIGLRRKVRS